jgi:N-acetylglucosamine kinase-like BadF-type ATPase
VNYFLGIDGGGTKTTAAVCNENGEILCRATGKTLNFYSVGMESCRENLQNLMTEIENSCGVNSFKAVVIGCSAIDSKADDRTVEALCGGIINSPKIYMDSDAYVALKAAKDGCVAICGTGSMAIGERCSGEIVVTGGWGHIIGDEGSAYSISISAFKKCCEFADNNISSPLLERAKAFFKVDDFRKAIDYIYSFNTTKAEIAKFSAEVDALARENCPQAAEIIREEAVKYSKTVASLLSQLDDCKTLYLYGGVFKNSSLFREEFSKSIVNSFPNITIKLLTISAEEGALRVAMKL